MKEKRGKIMLKILLGGSLTFTGMCLYSGNHKFYTEVAMPCARLLDGEVSHDIAIKVASYGLLPRMKLVDDDCLRSRVLNMEFRSPIGLAAGMDKDAECFDSLAKLGFGFVEIGSVTPQPQYGNPKPRLFRLLEDRALINRFGFNSCGIEFVKEKLKKRNKKNVLGVNLGVNKNSPNALDDYKQGILNLGPFADYIVINVSSPNTPGLRDLQTKKYFDTLLKKVTGERNKIENKPPLLIKIAPDLTDQELEEICFSAMANHVDGLIVCNGTVSRQNLKSPKHLTEEVGGLSGAPLYKRSNDMIKKVYKLTKGKMPIIGVGGVFTAEDALEKMKCGASLVQLYTGFVYLGPTCINKINSELVELIKKENVTNISQLVGKNS